jgi:hypothetical protein
LSDHVLLHFAVAVNRTQSNATVSVGQFKLTHYLLPHSGHPSGTECALWARRDLSVALSRTSCGCFATIPLPSALSKAKSARWWLRLTRLIDRQGRRIPSEIVSLTTKAQRHGERQTRSLRGDRVSLRDSFKTPNFSAIFLLSRFPPSASIPASLRLCVSAVGPARHVTPAGFDCTSGLPVDPSW